MLRCTQYKWLFVSYEIYFGIIPPRDHTLDRVTSSPSSPLSLFFSPERLTSCDTVGYLHPLTVILAHYEDKIK